MSDVTVSNAAGFVASAPARFLEMGLSVNALRTNGLLREDEWKEVDRAVQQVARQQMNICMDLTERGLVQKLGGLGTILTGYDQMSDMTAASINMSGVTPGEEDTTDFNQVLIPVPIIHKDFRISIRRLHASRSNGDGLDVTEAQLAARLVSEAIENMVFNGASVNVNGNQLYGLTTHPSRNTDTAAGDFGTISNIFPTVNEMVSVAEGDNYYGPYGLYVARTQYGEMRAVYTDGSGQSAIARCLASIPGLEYIKPSSYLTDGSLVLVTLASDVIDLAVAQDIVPVEWTSYGGMVQHFKVMAAMAPRVKSDRSGQSGVVHYTGA